jgi:hypothetical protein
MPRKIEISEVDHKQEPVIKPKRQITDAQREHLNKIRELAMAKKKELKEITLKSKLAKAVPRAEREELAAQYDNYIAQKATQQPPKSDKKPKPRVDPEPESESEEEEVFVKKPKPKKKVKKIVYESESEEEVIVRKKKPPLEKLVYDNTKDQLYHRMIEERVRNTILGYGSSLGV